MRATAGTGRLAFAAALAGTIIATPAHADDAAPEAVSTAVLAAAAEPNCSAGTCQLRLTGQQLLGMIERLMGEKKFAEAQPLVTALQSAPGMELPYHFLDGLIALETGNPRLAAARFRAILAGDPGQTRVRLELARALAAQGDFQAADYHLRLAQDDEDLPQEVLDTIRHSRSVIRTSRDWRFGFDVGLAPDTNINGATNAETIDVNFGASTVPLTLDPAARARSGLGVTASSFGSLRLPTSERMSIVADVDASMVNYEGKEVDDYTMQVAAGPELRLSPRANVTLQAVGLYRLYGGQVAARQVGSKLGVQLDLSRSQRVGLQLDGRRTDSDFGEGYTGWQLSAVATYEQVIARTFLASATLFARRDAMELASNSNSGAGISLGVGGELPLGINAGLSGGVSYAAYDAPQYFFSAEERQDTRYQGRIYLGLRKLRWKGFSPSIEYTYSQVDTNYELYRSSRHRYQFKLARYF
jgi:hypothetical protein